MGDAPVRGFSVRTRCRSVEEFVETYKALSDGESITVDTVEPCAVGSQCAFAILLANERPVLAGTGVVLDVLGAPSDALANKRVRVGIMGLGVDSERVFAALARARSGGPPRRRIRTVTIPSRAEPLPRPARTLPPFSSRAPPEPLPSAPQFVRAEGSNELSRERRTPGSSLVLPANPLMNLSDASLEGLVDCRLFEAASAALLESAHDTGGVPLAVDVESTVPEPCLPLPGRTDRLGLLLTRLPAWVWAATVVGAIAIGAGVGGGVALVVKQLASRGPTSAVLAADASIEPAFAVRITSSVEAPPPPPPRSAPTRTHAVLVQTAPIAARVVVEGRGFGTTPTYVKVPAFEPVKLEIRRAGFKPVVRTVTSRKPYERVFIRLERKRRLRR